MQILLVPIGSSGDVLPFCGLGAALRARGHDVAVAVNEHFAPVVERAGLALLPLGSDEEYQALLRSPDHLHRVRGFRRVMQYAGDQVRPLYELIAAHRSATVLTHPLAFGARIAEAKHDVATATLYLSPVFLQSAHEPPVMPGVFNGAFMPSWYKRSVWWAADRLVIDGAIGPSVNACRKSLGLPKVKRIFHDGWESSHPFIGLFPEWFAPRQPDWPRNLTFTGFPLYDEADAASPAEVKRYLDAGEPPIVFTAGTGNRHAREFFAAAIDVSARIGRRALLVTRFGELLPPSLPAHAHHFDYVPFSRLLPDAAALVHHGGIGTSAAALAAGVPQVVIGFSYDQPDNAARVARLGVGAALPPQRFSIAALASRLLALLHSPAVASRCREVAARIAASDGVEAACLAVERTALGKRGSA